MSRLSAIQTQIAEVSEGIRRFEQAASANPSSSAVLLNLRSLENMRKALEKEFYAVAASSGLDVCSYRVFGEADRQPVRSAFSVCLEFQKLFSVVYSAMRLPLDKAGKLSRHILETTEFGLGFSFNGSIGFVFTLPNPPELYETKLDEAMKTLLEMAQAGSTETVIEFYKRLGRAPMKALHDWAQTHAATDTGADIKWTKNSRVTMGAFIENQRLRHLTKILQERKSEKTDIIELQTCVLQSVSALKKTFAIEVPGVKETIVGELATTVDRDHTVEIPADYSATIRRVTRTSLITEEDETSYFLLRLERRA